MTTYNRTFSVILGAAVLLTTEAAFADVTPYNESTCSQSSLGATCNDEFDRIEGGSCLPDTCSHNDYQHPDDAGWPTLAHYPCLTCQVPDGGVAGHGVMRLASGGAFFAVALVPLIVLGLLKRRRT